METLKKQNFQLYEIVVECFKSKMDIEKSEILVEYMFDSPVSIFQNESEKRKKENKIILDFALTEAEENQNGYAHYLLALFSTDWYSHFRWLEQSHNLKNFFGTFALAEMYETGTGISQDIEKALELYHQSARLGNSNALNYLASLYSEGKYIPRNLKKSIRLYQMGINRDKSTKCFSGLKIIQTNYPEEIRRYEEDQQVLFLLLLCHNFQPDSLFYKENFPLDILKIILEFSDIFFILPPKKEEKRLSNQIYNYCWKEHKENGFAETIWPLAPSFILGIWIALQFFQFLSLNMNSKLIIWVCFIFTSLIWYPKLKQRMNTQSHKCPTCGKTVYYAEKMDGLKGEWYHKLCFKCSEEKCKTSLKPGGFWEHDGKLFCQKCYHNKIQLQGYGFGGSGGTLSSYKNIDDKPESEITEGN